MKTEALPTTSILKGMFLDQVTFMPNDSSGQIEVPVGLKNVASNLRNTPIHCEILKTDGHQTVNRLYFEGISAEVKAPKCDLD